MTAGHRHRYLHVAPDGLVYRFLRGTTIARTRDWQRAERSRFVYGPDGHGGYRLSLLGFLHGLCGLTLAVPDHTTRGP